MTGHASHFLSRLGRADVEQTELALTLYRSPDTLRLLLASLSHLGESDRVALSLDAADVGPYVIATAQGNFVTCLGKGMAPAGARLVPHSQVCAYLQKTTARRDKLEAARRLGGEQRFLDVVTKRVLERGNDLSREELVAASVLQPVLELDYLVAAVDHFLYVRERERELLKLKVVRPKHHDALRRYWRSYYAAGHLLTLAAMDGCRNVPPDLLPELGFPLRAVFALGQVYLGARALWAAARIGKPALPICKQACMAPESDLDWLFGFLGLAVLAARHSKLHGEATKALDRSLKELPHQRRLVLEYVVRLDKDFFFLVKAASLGREKLTQSMIETLRRMAYRMCARVKTGPPCAFPSVEAIPTDFAGALIASAPDDYRSETEKALLLAFLLPYLAQVEAEHLYLPQAAIAQFQTGWVPAMSDELLENTRAYYGSAAPVVAEKKPGPNAPCPCGSGRKYKRCCAEKADKKDLSAQVVAQADSVSMRSSASEDVSP